MKYSSKIQHIWTFILDGIPRRVDFWDSKISGKKKLSVDSKVLAFDESGSSHFECIFKINQHKLKLSQKSEDKFSLSIDHYKFNTLMSEESKGNLKNLIEQSRKNPLDDVDKLLKSQIEKEKKEKKERAEKEAKEKGKRLMKELKEKENDKDFDFISAKDIKEIKKNLNNNNNKEDKNKIFEENKNKIKNISIFNDNKKLQNSQNINDFKRNSNMFGLDFFTGDKEDNNINNNIKNDNNFNPFDDEIKNNEQENNNMKNAQNPHNKEVYI